MFRSFSHVDGSYMNIHCLHVSLMCHNFILNFLFNLLNHLILLGGFKNQYVKNNIDTIFFLKLNTFLILINMRFCNFSLFKFFFNE